MKFFTVGLAFVLFGFASAAYAGTEAIDNFDVKVAVEKDGSILVTEAITYNFDTNERHGIFRDIPLTAPNGPRLNVKVLSVANERGEAWQYSVFVDNDVLHIKIGNPRLSLFGRKIYVINYKIHNAIRTFEDHDELYWNVTGDAWSVEIKNASAAITLPDLSITDMKMDCFTGRRGSTEKNCTFASNNGVINFSTTRALGPSEGLTIVGGIPRGYINNAYVLPQDEYGTEWSRYNLWKKISVIIFVLAIFVSIFSSVFGRFFNFRRKPKPVIPKELKGKPVTVEYNPPDGLAPIEIGTILDRKMDFTDLSSVIIDLAVRGYLKIRDVGERIKFWPDREDFELIKIKDGADLTLSIDKIVFDFLFNKKDAVRVSELKRASRNFPSKKIGETLESKLKDDGYFYQRVLNKKHLIFGLISFIVLMMGVLASFTGLVSVILWTSTIVYFKFFYKTKLTRKGSDTLAKILGFREFLQLTEKDKLALLNAPELRPETFEKFLPYAMVLGVEDKWAQKFESIYQVLPEWYEGRVAVGFNSTMLSRNLMMFNNSFNKAFGASASTSRSGFSGGSSGGGSGGGGGGSW